MPAPERLLFVKPVLGNTYAAVAASTAVSAWVQPADRTAGAIFPNHATPAALAGHAAASNEESADDPFSFDLDHAVAWRNWVALESRYDGAGETGVAGAGAAGGISFFHSGGMVSGTYPGVPPDDDPFYFVDSHGITWLPSGSFPAVNPNQSKWVDSWRQGWAEGAIGYEVEQYELDSGEWAPLSDPVAATITFTLADVSTGGQFFGAVTRLALNDRFGTAEMTAGGVALLQAPDHNRANAEYVAYGSLETPVGAPDINPDVPVSLTVDNFATSPARSGLFALWQSATIPGTLSGTPDSWPNTNEIALLSQAQGLTVIYTIRPPRIRWIYDSIPYRRIYPRDDAMAGGAPRTWPPSKAIQSGNRTSGGYL